MTEVVEGREVTGQEEWFGERRGTTEREGGRDKGEKEVGDQREKKKRGMKGKGGIQERRKDTGWEE